MSSTNKTTYYELPQFVDNDIFNPLVDDNDAYSKIDTALHNIANAEADDASEIVGIKSRLDSAEGDIDTLEAQNGDNALTTEAQTLSGAVNELDADVNALDGRLDIVEDDINNASTGLKVKVVTAENDIDALEAQNGSESLTTTAQTLSGAVNEIDSDIEKAKWFVTPEEFGAVGDGVTDDTVALQTAIDYARTNGKTLILKGVTYLVTASLQIGSGTKIVGAGTPRQYTGGFGCTIIKANIADISPVISISTDALTMYLGGDDTVRDEVYIENINIYGEGAFCGIKCKLSNSSLKNISIYDCNMGVHCGSTYTTYFDHVNCIHCEIGFYLRRKFNYNNALRDCWINYGATILNSSDLSADFANAMASELGTLTKITSIFIFGQSHAYLENCCIEGTFYGIYLRSQSSCIAKNLHAEQIVADGAVFSDNPSPNPNYVKADGLSFYNGNDYSGKIAIPGYRSQYYLKSDYAKPANFTDSVNSSRGAFKLEFRNEERYLDIAGIAGMVNPVITNNYTRFDEHGNIIVDFVLKNYDSQDTSVAPILSISNLDGNGFNAQDDVATPIVGTDFQYNHKYHSITGNGTGAFELLAKNTRYSFLARYTPT